ncbi:hypothetical protein D3C81_2065120 [compost metagenome]
MLRLAANFLTAIGLTGQQQHANSDKLPHNNLMNLPFLMAAYQTRLTSPGQAEDSKGTTGFAQHHASSREMALQ